MPEWTIEQEASGWDVRKDGRPVQYDLPTLEEARYLVESQARGTGATLTIIDTTGYRVTETIR